MHLVALVILVPAVQVSLGDANLFNLWAGKATPLDVENALADSPFGLHGVGLLVAFSTLIVWHHQRLAGRRSRLSNITLLLALAIFISQGKAQGFVYFGACILLQQTSFRSFVRTGFIGTAAILLIFFVTRIARNQTSADFGAATFADFDAAIFLLSSLLLGFYFGSPVANSAHIFGIGGSTTYWNDFLAHIVPTKIGDTTNSIVQSLPDPTSPSGLIGSALLLGGPFQALMWLVAVGLIAGFLYRRSKISAAALVFMPFAVVSCGLSMMYDHFANLAFFWIPLLLSILICSFVNGRPRSTNGMRSVLREAR
jgi:hypothetical protein